MLIFPFSAFSGEKRFISMIGHELIIDEHPRGIMIECGDVATYGVNNVLVGRFGTQFPACTDIKRFMFDGPN